MKMKKFLDQTGISVIWSKIENNYPTNDDLTNIVNAIDETKADTPKISTIILSSSSWNITTLQQEVAVTGISADQTAQIITISPDTSCYTEYLDAGVQCIGQVENSLTFSVEEIPSSDFTVYVAVQNCR